MGRSPDILDMVSSLKATGEPFVLATVVRTLAATAAKPGAKAVIRANGTLSDGWVGGGCAKAAVLKAAQAAINDGKPRLVSIQPEDLLTDQGLQPGSEQDGVRFARNLCPSQGTLDVFVEPVLPQPELIICGSSPVAVALADLARRIGFACVAAAPAAEQAAFTDVDRRIDGFLFNMDDRHDRFVVVSTQGRGDEAALKAALTADTDYVAFVGSRAKVAALRKKLIADGVPPARFDTLHAPAGQDLGAITPEEIALSILAEIVAYRRRGQRG